MTVKHSEFKPVNSNPHPLAKGVRIYKDCELIKELRSMREASQYARDPFSSSMNISIANACRDQKAWRRYDWKFA